MYIYKVLNSGWDATLLASQLILLVDTQDSNSRAKERGGSTSLQGIISNIENAHLFGISLAADHKILVQTLRYGGSQSI